MNYSQKDIKKGIKLHCMNTNKFKTNLIAVILTTKLDRKNVTKNALIPAVLRRGTASLNTQEEINKRMEELYGATLDCGLDKTGDNQVLKFYIETINDEFLPNNNEDMLKQALDNVFELVFNPYVEDGAFKKEYVNQEKKNLKQIIEGKTDNKAMYAKDKCIEEMYKGEAFGLYRYGYVEDLEKIDESNLYSYYNDFINTCKIDIFISGILDDTIEDVVKENVNIQKLNQRDPEYILPVTIAKKSEKENVVNESMEVNQGKLVIGLDLDIDDSKMRYNIMLYNSLLGGSANSKLFQNVREKASLAYTASSGYNRYKNNIFINCGIEIENYDKALDIIKKQIDDMRNGDFEQADLDNAKQGIISVIKSIDDEQDTEIMYYFGQELSGNHVDLDGYMKNVSNVKKEDVINVANKVSINTIFFLRN